MDEQTRRAFGDIRSTLNNIAGLIQQMHREVMERLVRVESESERAMEDRRSLAERVTRMESGERPSVEWVAKIETKCDSKASKVDFERLEERFRSAERQMWWFSGVAAAAGALLGKVAGAFTWIGSAK